MRRAMPVGVVAVLCWASGAEAAIVPCGPSDARTLQTAGESRVFARGERIYACVTGSRTRRLGTRPDPDDCITSCDGLDRVALAGRFVAFSETFSNDHGSDPGFLLKTLDLRSGRVRMRAHAGEAGDEDAVLSRVVLSRSGATAWSYRHTRGPLGQEPSGVAIERDPRCGRPVLDDGRAVRPNSLRIRGNRLVWRSGDTVRSGPFCRRHATPQPVCGPPGARKVADTRTSRLWTHNGELWGCTRGFRAVLLQASGVVLDPSPKLAERAAAFGHAEPGGFSIVSADLARRTQRVAGAAHDGARLRQLELDVRGRVAYLHELGGERTLMRDATCSPQLVDRGPGIEPWFLLVNRDTLLWTVGIESRNAPLC